MTSLFTKCAHVWGPAEGTYYGPYEGDFRVSGFVDFAEILNLVYGQSRLHQRCTRCDVVRRWSVAGRVTLTHPSFVLAPSSELTRRRTRDCQHDFTTPRFESLPPTHRRASLAGMVTENQVRYLTEGISTGSQVCQHCNFVRTWTRIGLLTRTSV